MSNLKNTVPGSPYEWDHLALTRRPVYSPPFQGDSVLEDAVWVGDSFTLYQYDSPTK